MSSEVATRPATLTCAPGPNSTPFGFTRNTLPFEVSAPWMSEPDGPTTRLSTVEDDEACWKRVVSLAPMLKPCQLMIVPLELVTVSVLPELLKVALPDTTVGPLGLASAEPAASRTAAQIGPVSGPASGLVSM